MGKLLPRKRGPEPRPEGVWRVPKRYNVARDVVEAFAADPDRPALTFVDCIGVINRWTFRDVAYEASRWATLLRSRGLGPGDRVLVLVGRTPAWPAVLLGALKAGLVPVPCSETLGARDLESRVEHSRARLGVTDRARARAFAEIRARVDFVIVEEAEDELRALPTDAPTHDTAASDIAFLLDSSDPANPPQEVTHGDTYAWAKRLQAEHALDAQPRDLIWCAVGTEWAPSIQDVLLGPWSNGAEIVIHEGDFDPEQRLELVQRLGVTALCQTPTEYRLMAEHPSIAHFDLGLLRHAVSVGGPLDPDVIRVFREAFGLTVYDGYRPAEATLLVADARDTQIEPASSMGPKDDLLASEQRAGAAAPHGPPAPGTAAAPGPGERAQASAQHGDQVLLDVVLLGATQATAEQARHAETEARRAAEAQAKEDERQRKQEEKRRREQAKAAVAQARRAETEARRTAEAQAKEDERQRKHEEKRRQEQTQAATAQSRRDAEERRRAERTAEEARRAAEAERRDAEERALIASNADAADAEEGSENHTNPVLISRLLAYGRLDDTGSSDRRAE